MAPTKTKTVRATAKKPLSIRRTPINRRGIIADCPSPSVPLPKDIDHESIIKHYPNHLRGDHLLEIAGTWTPKEISTTSGRATLRPNTIVKRIKAAKIAAGHLDLLHKKSSRAAASAATTTITNPGASSSSSSPPSWQPQESFTESSASRNFLEKQLALREIIQELDPEYQDRQLGLRKKSPQTDRLLVDRAADEYERRMRMRMMEGAGNAGVAGVAVDKDRQM